MTESAATGKGRRFKSKEAADAYIASLKAPPTMVPSAAAPTPGVTVEYTYQVVADGDILNDFTKMDDALKYAVGLNADWRRVEIVRITWEHIRVR